MLTTLILCALLVGFALSLGWALDLRQANLDLQTVHARATVEASHTIVNLRYDVQVLGAICDRYAGTERQLVHQLHNSARENCKLAEQLDQARVDLAKVVLGATEIPPAQQQQIDTRVEMLSAQDQG